MNIGQVSRGVVEILGLWHRFSTAPLVLILCLTVVFCFLILFLSANGYVRSEGITAVYLQKKKDAKRIYCYAVHAKTNSDGHKSEGK